MTAAKLSCQPTSPAARGLSARVTAGGEQERVPARARPAGERGDDPGRAHHAGPLDRRARAGDRHVDARSAPRIADQAGADRDPEQRQHGGGEEREQDDVLAADGEQVGEARSA